MLSIDWDFFFPTDEGGENWQLYDWGHNEDWPPSLQQALWLNRAEVFDRHGIDRNLLSDDVEGLLEQVHVQRGYGDLPG